MTLKKISAQKAINNHCKGCIYDPKAGGTAIAQIENCSVTSCELYHHRPRSSAAKAAMRQEFLANLTPEQRFVEEKKSEEAAERLRKIKNAR